MRAKFIRGEDPLASMGLGVDGEILWAGHYKTAWKPTELSPSETHDLLANWERESDTLYVFRYRSKGQEREWDALSNRINGKVVLYDGKIYHLPKVKMS